VYLKLSAVRSTIKTLFVMEAKYRNGEGDKSAISLIAKRTVASARSFAAHGTRCSPIRHVGNLIPPSTADGISIGDVSEASAIEYSVLVLKVANIVICGHSECGAMQVVSAGREPLETPNLAKWLHHAHAAAFRLEHEGALDSNLKPHDQLSQVNVLVDLEHLMSYPIVREKVVAGTLQVSGW